MEPCHPIQVGLIEEPALLHPYRRRYRLQEAREDRSRRRAPVKNRLSHPILPPCRGHLRT